MAKKELSPYPPDVYSSSSRGTNAAKIMANAEALPLTGSRNAEFMKERFGVER